MRKLLFAILLPVILLLSQQGAVLHEIGHITDFADRAGTGVGVGARSGAQTGSEPGSHQASDLQCQACLAFAHLAGVATATVVPPALLGFSFHFAVIEAPAFIAADAPAARSRGPPTFL
jgi:hypothetical protein